MKDKIFYGICFGFIGGVLLHSFSFLGFYFILLVGLFSLASVLFSTLVSKNKIILFCSVFVLSACVGFVRTQNFLQNMPQVLENNVGKEVSFDGLVVDNPDIRENSQKLLIEAKEEDFKVKILVSTDLYQDFAYGDVVHFNGVLEKPENFLGDNGKEFDYVNYLKKDGILYLVNFAQVERVASGRGNFIKRYLFSFKNSFLRKIDYAVSSPESVLLGGLVLGDRGGFSEEQRENFIKTGTIHIVALSGYNVTIVAEWFMKLFSFLPIVFNIGAGIFAIVLFVLMTGASSTGVRAGVMAVLVLIARLTGRNYDVGRALILTAFLMLLFNPMILVYDVSFELSFLATVAVIFFTPKIEKYFMWVTARFGLRDVVSVTFSAYVFVLPFILYKMGNISLVALPANVLVLPFIPLTMVLGFITAFAGFLSIFISLVFGLFAQIFLNYELFMINLLAEIPFASFSIPNFPAWLTIACYAYLTYLLFGRSLKKFLSFNPIS